MDPSMSNWKRPIRSHLQPKPNSDCSLFELDCEYYHVGEYEYR